MDQNFYSIFRLFLELYRECDIHYGKMIQVKQIVIDRAVFIIGPTSARKNHMHVRLFPFLLLLTATVAMASSPDFRLGIDYTEWADPGVAQIATDNSGALYMLAAVAFCSGQAASCVIKL